MCDSCYQEAFPNIVLNHVNALGQGLGQFRASRLVSVLSVFRRVVDSRAAVRGEAEVASEEECDGGVILPPLSRNDEALRHLLLD